MMVTPEMPLSEDFRHTAHPANGGFRPITAYRSGKRSLNAGASSSDDSFVKHVLLSTDRRMFILFFSAHP